MSDNIGERSLVRGVFAFEGIEAFRDATVVSSPFFSDLGVENLSDGNNGVWSGDIGGNTTGNTSNDCLFARSQIVSWLDWFGLIVDKFIESVSDSKISQSGDEVSFKTLVEA